MSRETLERKEEELLDEILILGKMVETAMLDAVEALRTRDMEASKKVLELDKEINLKRFDIEKETLITIATQQPMATDLRILASVFEVSTELERMGDYAKGIAKINIRMGTEALLKPLIDIPKMAKIALSMLNKSLTAFVEGDEKAARIIYLEDDKVDALYEKIYRELIGIAAKDPELVDKANNLLWACHNIERLADRVTNICERTIFVVTGELVELADAF
ncbi:MAG: phosphate signaling complex protein PhoU [Chloroflexi bacterium]|jgi:phosphate transport system protein|nr:phosphate signaling complex protein PhoU [Chloroflexota bacterium]MBT3669443.1 phosphate signaling complex protein PhoU [Chloroflexota bacterium]MBT4002839.1 phosphate signaling complex protein PhoU [Chloroflexota bacterium]MBT4304538.1 phosphate signaling complex protein PhoU [Chloroflexota bacterium]MBT4534121.1 phosphate signaling complex protein PhoU [Chloroflexota bacterium]